MLIKLLANLCFKFKGVASYKERAKNR